MSTWTTSWYEHGRRHPEIEPLLREYWFDSPTDVEANGGKAQGQRGNLKAIPILNVYYLLCYAWGHVARAGHQAMSGHAGRSSQSVHDLLGQGTRRPASTRLFRRGIGSRDYVAERREDLAGPQAGSWTWSATLRSANLLRARGRAACDFEELSADDPAAEPVSFKDVAKASAGHARPGSTAESATPRSGRALQQARWHIRTCPC